LPEEETFLGMEMKMLIDKLTEIQTIYHKNLSKYSEDNNKLREYLKKYTEKYLQMDKKINKINHLLKEKQIKTSLINANKDKNRIYVDTSKTNKLENEILNSIHSGKINKNYEKERDFYIKSNELNKYLKEHLFQVINSIIKNPNNKNKINENILNAFNYLQEKDNYKKIDNPFQENLNEKENYYSPHFSKKDQSNQLNPSTYNQNNILLDGKKNFNKEKCINNDYESNIRIDNNVITLNDINSANVSPDTNKNNSLLFNSDKNHKELSQQETDEILQTSI